MFEEMTKRKKAVPEKLLAYGFQSNGELFQYVTDMMHGTFTLTIQIYTDSTVKTNLTEKDTGEAYILYKTNASGSYVGEIRSEIEQILGDIVQNCYEAAVFQAAQTQTVMEFVREAYGDAPEFLWKKFPDNAVLRRKDNKKWYGAILTVAGNKLGLESDGMKEVIDLRMNPAEAKTILSRRHYYPGWHMNKNRWYTIILDGSISNEELKERIRESYKLAKK